MFLDTIVLADPFVKLVGWEWLEELTFPSIAIRLILALLCGCFLGGERALKHQAAGLRTYTLVCLGSAVAMITNQFIMTKTGLGDSARLGAQVISGIGFLGAGTIIITSRNQIRGLTTAAGLWACACIGLAIGSGFYTVAIFAMLALVLIFLVLPSFEKMALRKSRAITIYIEFENIQNLKEFVNFVRGLDIKIQSTDRNEAYRESGLSVYTISMFITAKPYNHEEFLSIFRSLPYVNYVEEIR